MLCNSRSPQSFLLDKRLFPVLMGSDSLWSWEIPVKRILAKLFHVVSVVLILSASIAAQEKSANKPRARDLGVPFDGTPGPNNAITDVAGVTVGHTTLIAGSGKLQLGHGPVRTGVTAVLPRGPDSLSNPVFAGWFAQNGNGEMTGTAWGEEA